MSLITRLPMLAEFDQNWQNKIGSYYRQILCKINDKNREKLLRTYGLLRNKSKIHFSYESTAILSLAPQ